MRQPESVEDNHLEIFELLMALHDLAPSLDRQAHFEAFLDRWERERPAAYDAYRHRYLQWRIVDAIERDRPQMLCARKDEFVVVAERDIDAFNEIAELLAWHGRTDLLAEIHAAALPTVQQSDGIIPSGIDAFEQATIKFAVFKWAEEGSFSLPELKERLCAMGFDINVREFEHDMALLRGQSHVSRRLSAFDLDGPRKEKAVYQELHGLTLEFINYACQVEGQPRTRANLAAANLRRYIHRRHGGQLHDRRSLLDRMLNPGLTKKRPRPRHSLCPDRATFDAFLSDNLDLMYTRPYSVVAVFGLLPVWLRFLRACDLLDDDLMNSTLKSMKPLQRQLLDSMAYHGVDCVALESLRDWPNAVPAPIMADVPSLVG